MCHEMRMCKDSTGSVTIHTSERAQDKSSSHCGNIGQRYEISAWVSQGTKSV